jgi:hypothetical protein
MHLLPIQGNLKVCDVSHTERVAEQLSTVVGDARPAFVLVKS